MIDRYSHICQAVLDQPWAILPETYTKIVSLVQLRAAGVTLTRADVEARIGGSPRERPETNVVDGIGVISMFGVLAQRMNLFASISGGTSTEQMAAEFRALVDDRDVRAIVFAIDSPGGSVYGIDELASEIRASRGRKPIIAHADSMAASAAYWLGAQADEVIVTPGGDVGSIGIVTAHTDLSGAAEKAGIKTTLISAGPYKTEGNPYAPLSEEAAAHLQSRVDVTYTRFLKAVAGGRRVTESAVRTGFGQGRLLGAEDALALGMVDRIESFDQTFARLQGRAVSAPAPLRAEKDAEVCGSCNGSGLKPERYMGDPQGQQKCPTCNGTGKAATARQEPSAATRASARMPESLWRALVESDL
jgi:signal peptide peptidase SppA